MMLGSDGPDQGWTTLKLRHKVLAHYPSHMAPSCIFIPLDHQQHTPFANYQLENFKESCFLADAYANPNFSSIEIHIILSFSYILSFYYPCNLKVNLIQRNWLYYYSFVLHHNFVCVVNYGFCFSASKETERSWRERILSQHRW